MNRAERALEQFSTSSACSQAVAVAFEEDTAMDFASLHRSMAGFGGGMGTQQLTCGAIVGGVFALSAIYGTEESPDPESKALLKGKVDAFFEAVGDRFGSTDCRSLLGHTLSEASEKGLFKTRCPELVQACVEEVEKLLEEG